MPKEKGNEKISFVIIAYGLEIVQYHYSLALSVRFLQFSVSTTALSIDDLVYYCRLLTAPEITTSNSSFCLW